MGQPAKYAEVGEYWPRVFGKEEEELLDQYTSLKFFDGMKQRMLISHFKYGDTREGYPEKINALNSLQRRIEMYLSTGNAEYLMDVANFAMIEFMHPSLPHAFFKPTDSDGSPGLNIRNTEEFTQAPHKDV